MPAFLGTMTGDSPSGLPPSGSRVLLNVDLVFIGTFGYSLRAVYTLVSFVESNVTAFAGIQS
jgi:hypothetical protein